MIFSLGSLPTIDQRQGDRNNIAEAIDVETKVQWLYFVNISDRSGDVTSHWDCAHPLTEPSAWSRVMWATSTHRPWIPAAMLLNELMRELLPDVPKDTQDCYQRPRPLLQGVIDHYLQQPIKYCNSFPDFHLDIDPQHRDSFDFNDQFYAYYCMNTDYKREIYTLAAKGPLL